MGEALPQPAPHDAPAADASMTPRPPLVVDLDGTLLATDTLYETIAAHLFKRPLATLAAVAAVVRGPAAMKACLADLGVPEPRLLPARRPFIAFLEAEKASGRALHLATAADERVARAVAEHYALFSEVTGSNARANLRGAAKSAALHDRYPGGFAYAGDSFADLAVWKGAKGAVLVGAGASVSSRVRGSGATVEAEFPAPRVDRFRAWFKALRLAQWTKNLLLFAPLFLAHKFADASAWASTVAAFVIMGVIASGTYLVNDLADLAADRQHRTKKSRPFASGALPVRDGLVVAPLMIFGGVAAAFALSAVFGALAAIYLATTLAYSFGLKRVEMVDVFILGLLYTIRVLMGVALLSVALSPWLVAFSFFFFFSMALAKRHVELMNDRDSAPGGVIVGRGYRRADWPVTLALGAATAYSALIVVVIYLAEEAFPSGAYANPAWLWAAPALIALWIQRIWLLAHRGELDDDPVAFAMRDRFSLLLGAAMVVAFALAVAT